MTRLHQAQAELAGIRLERRYQIFTPYGGIVKNLYFQ